MTKSVLFGAVLALTVTAASAAETAQRASFMLPHCKGAIAQRAPVGEWQALCVGVVRGIGFMGSMAKIYHTALKPLPKGKLSWPVNFLREGLCLDVPDDVATGQFIAVIISYIEARPARMQDRFDVLALEALRTAWPCR
jgi:Rap1a immunity proteins